MSDEAIKAALGAGWWAYCDLHQSPSQKMRYAIAAFLRDRARDADERGVIHLAYTFREEAAAVERAAREGE
jgi:hypothetical protein